jgi:hypothetical protein
MIASGTSIAEIGQATFLSEATVKTHVGRVRNKLGCRDRVKAVVFAWIRAPGLLGTTTMHGVRGFFRFAHIDGLIAADPAVYARLTKVHRDEIRAQGLDPQAEGRGSTYGWPPGCHWDLDGVARVSIRLAC